jgi:hypothetical protein
MLEHAPALVLTLPTTIRTCYHHLYHQSIWMRHKFTYLIIPISQHTSWTHQKSPQHDSLHRFLRSRRWWWILLIYLADRQSRPLAQARSAHKRQLPIWRNCYTETPETRPEVIDFCSKRWKVNAINQVNGSKLLKWYLHDRLCPTTISNILHVQAIYQEIASGM